MNVNILCIVPDPNDATSWYRAGGPLSHIKLNNLVNVHYHFADKVTDITFRMHNFVFMQRPMTDGHVEILQKALNLGKKVWVDYDDDVFDVPLHNPVFEVFADKRRRENIAYIIQNATHVTASTEHLKEKLLKLNKNVTVINNAFNFNEFKHLNASEYREPNNLISWRGSRTHEKDLMSVAGEIISCAKRHEQDFTFKFIGDSAWYITERLKNAKFSPWTGLVDYHNKIYIDKNKGFIVPLHFDSFNRSKSNIAWIEATWAGAVCVVPDMPEWKLPGALTYKTPIEFENALEQLITMNKDKHRASWRESYDCLINHYNLDTVNRARVELIKSFLD